MMCKHDKSLFQQLFLASHVKQSMENSPFKAELPNLLFSLYQFLAVLFVLYCYAESGKSSFEFFLYVFLLFEFHFPPIYKDRVENLLFDVISETNISLEEEGSVAMFLAQDEVVEEG